LRPHNASPYSTAQHSIPCLGQRHVGPLRLP
jgi:hypothetical protein